LLHKKSIKISKTKKYKDGKGSNTQSVRALVLPKQWDKK
jgi:hypothetical protein